MNESWVIEQSWLILGVPFGSFLLISLFLRNLSEKMSALLATLSIFVTCGLSLLLIQDYLSLEGRPTLVPVALEWLRFQKDLGITMGVLLDPLSVLLVGVVTVVSALVHLYSLGYMKEEKEGLGRYFLVLNFFTFSMLGLVVAPNLFQTFLFWELVGASSFFLIGFYYKKGSAVAASKKAFIVTRFADLGFLLGIVMLGYWAFQFHSGMKLDGALSVLDFSFFLKQEFLSFASENGVPLALSLILIFLGAAGKSAMFPLHIWLPDAMEGPTPVSALIHAATMVVAGVYLVARLIPLYLGVPWVLSIIAVVGGFTALFAAVVACAQMDIKRVLAYSTLSQLGYMMLSLGVCTLSFPLGFGASQFHLFTHAFFKALLFLGAGSVIHAVHTNEIDQMGGLARKMPVTHLTFLVATLAIAGFPPLAGFFSKDEILLSALLGGRPALFGLALFVAGLTSFYMFRIYFMTFWGEPRSEHAQGAHEATWSMTLPLGVLAIFSIFAGFVPITSFVSVVASPSHSEMVHPHTPVWLPLLATGFAVFGALVAYWLYVKEKGQVERIVDSLGLFYKWTLKKFYIDEIYLFVTHKVIFMFVAAPIAWFDRHVVDGFMNLMAWVTTRLGSLLRYLQTGQTHTYSMIFVLGALLLFFVMTMRS